LVLIVAALKVVAYSFVTQKFFIFFVLITGLPETSVLISIVIIISYFKEIRVNCSEFTSQRVTVISGLK